MALKDKSDWELNMEAIVDYFNRTEPETDEAAAIKDEFAQWNVDLSWYDRYIDAEGTYVKARNYRDRFNVANATNKTEKEAAERLRKEGLTSEKLRGEAEKARTTKGYYAEKKPFDIPYFKIAAVVGVTIGVAMLISNPLPLLGIARMALPKPKPEPQPT